VAGCTAIPAWFTASSSGRLWGIVLAGGEGTRLRPLVHRICGDDRPKQFAALLDSRSLLHATLDRVGRKIPIENTVVITSLWHAPYAAAEFAAGPVPKLLVQPKDRGTAAGVLIAVEWIRRREPDAVLAVFPSDHFVLDEEAFMNHVAEVACFARTHPELLILAGARPTGAEPGYGWIEPAGSVGAIASGEIRRVRQFREKPCPEDARTLYESGWLWNTFVMVGSARAFAHAGCRYLPRLEKHLVRAAAFIDTEDESRMVDQAYTRAPAADFSRAVLEARPPFLAVSVLPPVGWSDWGTPERVLLSLKKAHRSPAWLQRLFEEARRRQLPARRQEQKEALSAPPAVGRSLAR
jgi:mannose-1-phosphate guanylyltransferase